MEIKIEGLEHRYMPQTPFEHLALQKMNVTIPSGQFVAIIGQTGSGKSTFVQHLNGLLKPTAGTVQIGDYTIQAGEKKPPLRQLRKKVGMVFQYPEHQLFEETVEKDICYGPINFGMSEQEAKQKARDVLPRVGLTEDVLHKSPFDLSGGQMRRVAIAGMLAMEPDVLILDEPTAGLDPRGRKDIMDMFYHLHQERSLTTILVTHSMEDAARYADEIIVMDKGNVVMQGEPADIFSQADVVTQIGLEVPETVLLMQKIERKFDVTLSRTAYTTEALVDEVVSFLERG